jgi:hypothetical protein
MVFFIVFCLTRVKPSIFILLVLDGESLSSLSSESELLSLIYDALVSSFLISSCLLVRVSSCSAFYCSLLRSIEKARALSYQSFAFFLPAVRALFALST